LRIQVGFLGDARHSHECLPWWSAVAAAVACFKHVESADADRVQARSEPSVNAAIRFMWKTETMK
jgi:hypothetical protein